TPEGISEKRYPGQFATTPAVAAGIAQIMRELAGFRHLHNLPIQTGGFIALLKRNMFGDTIISSLLFGRNKKGGRLHAILIKHFTCSIDSPNQKRGRLHDP